MSEARPPIHDGLHERVITASLDEALHALAATRALVVRDPIDSGEAHVVLAQHLHAVLVRALRALPEEERLDAQLDLANRVLDLLAKHAPRAGLDAGDRVTRELLSALVHARGIETPAAPARPGIPLAQSALLVNAPREHRVGTELALELASADRVDLLCSFVKWSGYVRLRDALKALFRDRGHGRTMRVITTAYMGATERRALDELTALGAEVKVSYDTRRTRLHAKAWLFHRESGYTTAYIGSSNLSAAALTDGLEWNVRVSSTDNPRVVDKCRGTFEGYWADPEFESYDPKRDCARLDAAVREARGEEGVAIDDWVALELRAYPFQQEILDRLALERAQHDRHKNLVIAATGTGKTLVAAFDYERLAIDGERPSLLFVAHREDILRQSLKVFRLVLGDRSFGELYVGGSRPSVGKHVFASIQSLAQVEPASLERDAFEIVIVDEFHHAAAPTYDRLLRHLVPRELVGLTATPERSDGQSVLTWFDGRAAAEVRLWDAIDRGLLCPFQYFGVRDAVDLDTLTWRRGYVPTELEGLYTADDARVILVLNALRERVASVRRMRALAFCVSVRHAEFMATRFRALGVAALAITGDHGAEERDAAVEKLRRREVNVLFTVDLFNEGVDLPWVDTLLLLRPTESASLFLQQLGRGLRLHRDKDCLTVLDFIGKPHERFRFDRRFRALANATRTGLVNQLEQGFPLLPSGCAIHLEREAMAIVLHNVRRTVGGGTARLMEELRGVARGRTNDVTLAEFVRETGVDPGTIYRRERSFLSLKRAAGLPAPPRSADEDAVTPTLMRLLHLDDPGRISRIVAMIRTDDDAPPGDERARRERLMFGAALLGRDAPAGFPAWLESLRRSPSMKAELLALLDLLAADAPHLPRPLQPFPSVPLLVHCRYSLAEIMAAFGVVSTDGGRLLIPQTGVYSVRREAADLLFVTLQKSEKQYSPSTMYEDYAVSPTEFHWQSQNHVTPDSKAGARHVRHRELGVVPLLFVRETKKDDRGETAAYVFLGPVDHVSHRGERPMSIVWRFSTAMPADLFRDVKLAAG